MPAIGQIYAYARPFVVGPGTASDLFATPSCLFPFGGYDFIFCVSIRLRIHTHNNPATKMHWQAILDFFTKKIVNTGINKFTKEV
jgi:hypothetical protein